MNYIVTAKCENGHSQDIRIDGSLGRAWADGLAGLLDGTSSMFVHPPGPDSVIGKCGICAGGVRCSVTDAEPTEEDQGA